MGESPGDRLSSSLTFIYKFVFPTVWLGGFSIGTVVMFVTAKGPAPVFAVATVFGLVLMAAICFPLKSVVTTSDGLLVSNYSEEVLIPYAQIAAVVERKFMNPRTITVWLKTPGRFGKKIVFMPYTVFAGLAFASWTDHPVTELLREQMVRAAGRAG
jgi:hypothetical protein